MLTNTEASWSSECLIPSIRAVSPSLLPHPSDSADRADAVEAMELSVNGFVFGSRVALGAYLCLCEYVNT